MDDLEYMKLVKQKGNMTWKEFIISMTEELKNK